jgi:hypothetical protein
VAGDHDGFGHHRDIHAMLLTRRRGGHRITSRSVAHGYEQLASPFERTRFARDFVSSTEERQSTALKHTQMHRSAQPRLRG